MEIAADLVNYGKYGDKKKKNLEEAFDELVVDEEIEDELKALKSESSNQNKEE